MLGLAVHILPPLPSRAPHDLVCSAAPKLPSSYVHRKIQVLVLGQDPVKFDIIFLHGLNGDYGKTWIKAVSLLAERSS